MNFQNVEAMMARADWDGAIVECKAILQVQPTNARVHAYIAMCYMRKNDFATAETGFKRATLLDPKFWEAGVKQVQCLYHLKRYEEAYVLAQEWHRERPGDRTLNSMLDFLRPICRGERQGWERTAGLSHNVRLASEEED